MMRCKEARRILQEFGSLAVVTDEVTMARMHLHECSTCSHWREAESAWRSALQAKLRPREAPVEVKERVFAALSRARFETAIRRLRRRWMTGVAALAVLVLGLAVVWGWREARSDGGLSAAVVEDHLLYASRAAPAEFASADPAALADWFASRLDFAVRVPAIPGTTLLGGRLCSLTDRRAAVSFYRGEGGERMSLFQMTAENVQLGALRRMEGGRNRNLRCATRKGVSVLVWSDRGVLFALASEIGEDQLVRLAASL